MPTADDDRVFQLVRDALQRGARVDIDGLGSFIPGKRGGFTFKELGLPKVFITYVHEDAGAAERIYDQLDKAGFDPWLDRRRLMPGQNWPRAIEDALSVSEFVIALFSRRSVNKKGGFQAEIRYALDCARSIPLDQVFLIPVRLEDCPIPARIRRETQYVDVFPDWQDGLNRVFAILKKSGKLQQLS